MIQKIIRQLTNYKKYTKLFDQVAFKIIPMLNPDGVILGNFRSSCSGKDLNRCFFEDKNILFPEVGFIKKFVQKLKEQYGQNLMMFIDIHGHSNKKNVFLYGIDSILNNLQGRIFPRMISQKTQMFRYYSCNFKLKDDKKTTGRACFIKYFKNCYTIQSSMSCYFTKSSDNIYFTAQQWYKMGYYILISIQQYINMIFDKQLMKLSRNSLRNTVKSRMYRKRRKQFKKSETYDIYKVLGVTEKKQESGGQFSPFQKYVHLFNLIKQDGDSNFDDATQTDSQKQDYSKQQSIGFQQQLSHAKNLFQKAYKNCSNKQPKLMYNYYYEKRYSNHQNNHHNRQLSLILKQQYQKKQEVNNKSKKYSENSEHRRQSLGKLYNNFEKKVETKKRLMTATSEAHRPIQTESSTQKKFFRTIHNTSKQKKKIQPQVFQVSYKPLTYNLRLLAPQNYVKPSQIPRKKMYMPKRQLDRLSSNDIIYSRNGNRETIM